MGEDSQELFELAALAASSGESSLFGSPLGDGEGADSGADDADDAGGSDTTMLEAEDDDDAGGSDATTLVAAEIEHHRFSGASARDSTPAHPGPALLGFKSIQILIQNDKSI